MHHIDLCVTASVTCKHDYLDAGYVGTSQCRCAVVLIRTGAAHMSRLVLSSLILRCCSMDFVKLKFYKSVFLLRQILSFQKSLRVIGAFDELL